ncbi:MAG: hypothetical protein FJ135_15820 [Deltaproteobacteria bacterium]|nr:hypothetical protein [Deltaproteobacteria bacterium]
MTGITRWLVVLLLAFGLAGACGGWDEASGQTPQSGWEFFSSPTRSPSDTRWGSYKNELRLEREAAVAKHNYCPTGGCVVRLENVVVNPPRVQRGRPAAIGLTYTILTSDNVGIPVTIIREIVHAGNSLGRTTSKNLRTPNGTFTQEVNFTLPADSAPGLYTLKTRVVTGFGQDEKSIDFTVD